MHAQHVTPAHLGVMRSNHGGFLTGCPPQYVRVNPLPTGAAGC